MVFERHSSTWKDFPGNMSNFQLEFMFLRLDGVAGTDTLSNCLNVATVSIGMCHILL